MVLRGWKVACEPGSGHCMAGLEKFPSERGASREGKCTVDDNRLLMPRANWWGRKLIPRGADDRAPIFTNRRL